MKRRTFLTTAASASAALGLPHSATAQSAAGFPSKPITFIVPWPAGSGVDMVHRAHCEAASKILGQPIIVDNKAGGSGTVGPATMAATAKPDGYTLCQGHTGLMRLPFMQKLTFDPLKDFTWIMNVSGYTFGVVVRADAPWKTFQDYIADAKANPGKINYTTPGVGTSLHIGMEQIALQAGVKFTHVPTKGGSEAWAAIEGGHIMAQADASGWSPLVDAGKFRLLVIWTEKRNERWPAVPTLKETGYNFVFDSPFGIIGPKGMDPEIVKKLHDAFKAALDDEKLKALSEKFIYPIRYMDTANYNTFVVAMVAEQKELIDKLGLAKKDG
jgi:tripartite-type tricarboxylate transporter receptor subunit TctC